MGQVFFHSQNQKTSLKTLGTLAWHYDFRAPTSFSDADGKNTIKNVSGNNVFIRLYDFSENGRHLIFADALAPRVVTNPFTGVGTVAQFLGAQNSNTLSLTGVPNGTTFLNIANNSTPDLLNCVGGFANVLNQGAFYGNVSINITGETFTSFSAAGTFNWTKAVIPAGFNTHGFVQGTNHNMSLNGVISTEPGGLQSDVDFKLCFGKRHDINNFFTGYYMAACGFSNKMQTDSEHLRVHNILTA